MNIKTSLGKHDVFVVFKNADAAPEDALMSVSSVRFSLEKAKPAPGTNP